ncbi:MAG: zf-HC2 domain-containing protein [Deltaproteobacteria bacterium]|nr:zf-HC2 domain-containing protein [Deltaproteobacteria bacterium]
MRCEDAQELITAMVDQELPGAERSAVEVHLGECPRCARIYREERALKEDVRRLAAGVRAPAALKERIVAEMGALGAEGKPRRIWQEWLRPARSTLWPALAAAALVLLALPVVRWMQPRQEIGLTALATHERVLGRDVALIRAASEAQVKEQLIRSVAGRFAPMGFDFSGMNLRVVGGLIEEVKGRKILVTVYEGENPSLTCYTFLGTERDAPQDAGMFFDPQKKINFYLFSRGGVNGVLHREGNVICILVSKLPMSDLLEMARSKARPS